MPTPIPITVVEPNEELVKVLQGKLLPRYDVVHVCSNPHTAITDIMQALNASEDVPETIYGSGSNAKRRETERQAPRVIILSETLGEEATQEIRNYIQDIFPKIVVLALKEDEQNRFPPGDMGTIEQIQAELEELARNGRLSDK